MPSNARTVLSDATTSFRNNVKRMRSGNLRGSTRAKGKENRPPGKAALSVNTNIPPSPDISSPITPSFGTQFTDQNVSYLWSPTLSSPTSPLVADFQHFEDLCRWEPIDGMIFIKVHVPSTDDIWRFKVPEAIAFATFREKVIHKVGFEVGFVMSSEEGITLINSEDVWKKWLTGRIVGGRNKPLLALQLQ